MYNLLGINAVSMTNHSIPFPGEAPSCGLQCSLIVQFYGFNLFGVFHPCSSYQLLYSSRRSKHFPSKKLTEDLMIMMRMFLNVFFAEIQKIHCVGNTCFF